jgi:hypothetical protein
MSRVVAPPRFTGKRGKISEKPMRINDHDGIEIPEVVRGLFVIAEWWCEHGNGGSPTVVDFGNFRQAVEESTKSEGRFLHNV